MENANGFANSALYGGSVDILVVHELVDSRVVCLAERSSSATSGYLSNGQNRCHFLELRNFRPRRGREQKCTCL